MCKYQENGDFGYNNCILDGNTCPYNGDEDDCPACIPSEWDVMNGWFSDDRDGFDMWWWKNKGCPACKSKNIKIKKIDYGYGDWLFVYRCNDCNHIQEFE